MMQGVVYYRGGTISCFEKDTVIQTERLWPVDYYHLKISGTASIIGVMPESFPAALTEAVQNSVTMNRAEKQRILDLLGGA